MPSTAPPLRPPRPTTRQRGTSRAIYAVTGVVDEVNDLIVPGAFARTLASRPVKTVWHRGWKDPVGVVVVEVEEWRPGDPRFATIPDWPAEAGALVATVVYNLRRVFEGQHRLQPRGRHRWRPGGRDRLTSGGTLAYICACEGLFLLGYGTLSEAVPSPVRSPS